MKNQVPISTMFFLTHFRSVRYAEKIGTKHMRVKCAQQTKLTLKEVTFSVRLKNKQSGELRRYPLTDLMRTSRNKLPQRHQDTKRNLWLIFIFASLCLGGVNVLPKNAKK
jgi:hypothetical protein